MNWILIADIAYLMILAMVCLRIIYDTSSAVKTLAWLLLAIFVPVAGMLFYFSFGMNYRKRKLYSKKLIRDEALRMKLEQRIISYTHSTLTNHSDVFRDSGELVRLLLKDSLSPLSIGNKVEVLTNGEEKFSALLNALEHATHHIHIQYYIFEDDIIGNQIKEILIRKAKQGVKVRFIFDDFKSHGIRRTFLRELRDAGVEAYPFNRVYFLLLANRLNYRNHRKIVVIDGKIGFTGGINVGDRYTNRTQDFFWRDTHLSIDGPGVHYLQYLFLCDWNFSSRQTLGADREFFKGITHYKSSVPVQIAASGPDSPSSTIMLSLLKAIHLARKRILITTPYFIPGESIMDTLKVAALSGIEVKLLVPDESDSKLVNAAAHSYYTELLASGVEIFLYQKGFVHAKTLVIDQTIAVIGTANMDFRSFEMNFEVNAIVYDTRVAEKLATSFDDDILHAQKIDAQTWAKRGTWKQLTERVARLLSPLL